MAEPKVSILLTLVDKLTAPVEGARGALGKFGDAVSGVGAKIAALGVSAALGAFFKSAIEEGIKAEQSTIRLGHAVKNAGEKFDDWAPQIDATVTRLTKLTTYSDDDLSSALGNLITKTGDVKKSLELMGLVTDLAANKNISLDESATLVAKSLNGGGRLFKEYGITVGTAAEKTEQLAAVLKGSAAAAADSFGGRLANLGKAWGELKEDTGKAIIANAAVGDALASLTALIDTLAPKIASFVGWLVKDMVTSISRFVTEVQTFGANAALAILGVPDRFRLAWGKLMLAISSSIADSRVLMTVFGDGLTKIADKMGVSGARMVRESSVNLANLKKGHDEVIKGITATHAKGEDDRTVATTTGNKRRSDDDKETTKEAETRAKDYAAFVAARAKEMEAMQKESADIIADIWKKSQADVKAAMDRLTHNSKVNATVLTAVFDTITDGLDGVYGSAERVPPKVKDIGDEARNAARGAISLGQEFGAIDAQAASVLNNVVNLSDALKDGLKGISTGNLIGAVGALAGIMGGIFGDSPESKARKEALAKNTQRLQELRDRLGELLNISTPGGKIATLQGINVGELQGATQLTSGWGAGSRLNVGKVGQFLAQRGVSITDFRQLASDFGLDLNEEKGTFSAEMVKQLFSVLGSQQFTGFSNDLGGLIGRQDFLSGITGGSAGDTLAGLASALTSGSGSSALGGLFSGINLGDGVNAGDEAATVRNRAVMLAARFAGGGVSAGEMGGASNTVFMSLLERVIDLLNSIASTNATTAGAVANGGLGTIVDGQLGSSYGLSQLSLEG